MQIKLRRITGAVPWGDVLCIASLLLVFACGKKAPNGQVTVSERAQSKSLQDYAEKVGTSAETLLKFSDSLVLVKEAPKHIDNCLADFGDNEGSRDKFMSCLTREGRFFYSPQFLLDLVPVRIERLKAIHDPARSDEIRRSLKLLNWIFDLAVEQYQETNPDTYWMNRSPDGKWSFWKPDAGKKLFNQNDFNYQDGDVGVNVSAEFFSTLIPQYTFPERRLTHMWVYRGQRKFQAPHFIEAILGEGVWPTFRDQMASSNPYYEHYVLRYNDPRKNDRENVLVRRAAADFSESQIGSEYNFSGDNEKGYFCTFLASLSFAHAFFDMLTPSPLKTLKGKALFEEVAKLFPAGYTPLRKSLGLRHTDARDYSENFGVDLTQTHFPSAGDFLTVENFDPVAFFFRADRVRRFSDMYAFAEATVDGLDRGLTIHTPREVRNLFIPLTKDREMLKTMINMVRQLHRHSIMRDALRDNKMSLQKIDQIDPVELDSILDRLDSERKALLEAAKFNLGPHWGYSHFSNTRDVTDPEKVVYPRDFMPEMQALGPDKMEPKHYQQLKVIIDKLSFEDIEIIAEPFYPQLPVVGRVVQQIRADLAGNSGSGGTMKEPEKDQLTELLRTYIMLLLAVPSLRVKLADVKAKIASGDLPANALPALLKAMPSLASNLEKRTIMEFAVYQGLGEKAIEAMGKIRTALGHEHVWQTPPWVQRDNFNYILKHAPIIEYK